jgi:hypothetical protein
MTHRYSIRHSGATKAGPREARSDSVEPGIQNESGVWIPGSREGARPGMTMLIPRLQLPEPLPGLAAEPHELHLLDRNVIGR